MKAIWRCLSVAGLAVATPAIAQIPSSSDSILARDDKRARVEGTVELRRVAICAMRLDRAHGVNLLQSQPGSSIESRIGYIVGKRIEQCMSGVHPALRIQPAEMRGAVAQGLYFQDYPQDPEFAGVDKSNQPLPKDWLKGELRDGQKIAILGQDFAQCVVSEDPAWVATLVRTEPMSGEERYVLKVLRPHFGPCLMKGQKFTMDAARTRSFLAEALYRAVTAWGLRPGAGNGLLAIARSHASALPAEGLAAYHRDGVTGNTVTGDGKMKAVSTLMAASAIAASAPASAQSPQSSDKAIAIGRDVAKCIVRGDPNGARRALAATSDTFGGAYARLDDVRTGCLMSSVERIPSKERKAIGPQLSFSSPVQAGLLAEAWLLREAKPQLPVIEPRADYSAPWVSADANQRVVDEMANCIAERNPGQVADLIWAKPGSSEESQAMAAIQPLMGPCLASNATLKTSRIGTRVALATALYHRVTAPSGSASAPSKS